MDTNATERRKESVVDTNATATKIEMCYGKQSRWALTYWLSSNTVACPTLRGILFIRVSLHTVQGVPDPCRVSVGAPSGCARAP